MLPNKRRLPIRYGVKGKCDSPYGEDNPETTKPQYTYTCWWPKCESDDDCPSGQKCYCGVCSATFTSEGCGENKCCNRGYGNIYPTGECVDEGTPYGNYICISEIFISYPGIR
ncbi:MAG: hypothetical protein J7K59_02965 [Candidatus Korarchaeota archaeon]|nr:hypothetical protein [Candidatus Korarchaeota archaeon]